jgi:hypothetical protein
MAKRESAAADTARELVFTHVWLDAEGKPGKETLVAITFTDLGGKTELTFGYTTRCSRCWDKSR